MNRFITKTPKLVHWLFPKRVWAFSRSQPTVYLTFDDGPIPEVTPWVLDLLRKYDARATFFCIGENIMKHPEIATQILAEGHRISNHTFYHKNGWKTSYTDYLKDFEKFNSEFRILNSELKKSAITIPFRPPYGKMTSRQARAILKKGHDIIMWDVLSGDYDENISEATCLKNVLNHIKKGSIIVFHDSLKAEKNLRYALPKVLEYIKNRGWNCDTIS
ncbi:MAG: peptidoglycan/xylan/chitin deacetylase (PgdA/CDA1 family) [Saprospiraceae bacterium]|uniref:polysaccharide deacetylase family protein n=1 Tax=Patiriisocius sp. Uisw_047 TaxID=3230969 RepID=UPI0039EC2365